MPEVIRGQRLKLADLTPALQLELAVQLQGPAPAYDVSVMGLDQAGKLSDDRYMVFYNQPRSPEGAVQLQGNAAGETRFAVDLSRLPGTVPRLMITASVEGSTFGQLGSGTLLLRSGGQELARFRVAGQDFGTERAVILGELYFRDGWRFSAVGQGFAGGLDALVKAYGGEVSAPAPRPQPPTPAPPPPPPSRVDVSRPAAATAPTSRVSLSKVTLEKQGQTASISLSKTGGVQPVRVNLNWERNTVAPRRGLLGLLGGGSAEADLDLGCMYRLKDGQAGVVQALGNRFGAQHAPPYIHLDKDDRSGSAQDGENLVVQRPDLIDQVLVFAYIYEGTSTFSSVQGRLNIQDVQGNEIFMRLNNPDPRHTFCAIALFRNVGGRIEVSKEERYFQGHPDCDRHYGFGFQWTAGRKS
ncbi:TerD family protein [Deinococcus sonorensis]|uniref:TerD family protein n=2 Tax=Deinococcus sonorensis TaxID=309891 RepID=A0AAU7UC54_9DEIO